MFQTLEKWGHDFQTSFNQGIYITYPSKINHGQQMKNNEISEEQFKCIFLITRSIRLKSQQWGQNDSLLGWGW
jgi:hypothetical protein